MFEVVPSLFKGLLEVLPPLRKAKRPNAAALLALFTGPLGFGLYVWSFVDIIVGLAVSSFAFVAFPTLPLIWAVSALWAYLRVADSNRRLSEAPTTPVAAAPAAGATWPAGTTSPTPPPSTGPAPAPAAGAGFWSPAPPADPQAGAVEDIWANHTAPAPTPPTPAWWAGRQPTSGAGRPDAAVKASRPEEQYEPWWATNAEETT